jgi:superfamily II DNA/RNA helicase
MLRNFTSKLNKSAKYSKYSTKTLFRSQNFTNFQIISPVLTYAFSAGQVKNQYEKNIPLEKLKINQAVKESCLDLKYEYLTPIQEDSFPLIAEGINTAIMSETGSGKTLAYALPIVNNL